MSTEPLLPQAAASPRFSRLRTLWQDRVNPKTYLGLHLTVGLAIAATSIWLFATLLDAVLDNAALVQMDIAVDAAIHRHMSVGDLRIVNVVTQLGAPVTMAVLGLAVAVALWFKHHHTLSMGWLAAFVGGAAINQILKTAVHRTRPEYGAAYLHGASYSFPSGHAMGAIIGYGMVLYLVKVFWEGNRRARRTVYALLVLMMLAVGLSRILLGVHYPSDVVGGYAAGGAWMAVCIMGIGIAQQRRMDRARQT